MDKGFTLIEVSIVLLIIGLVTSAILVGQDLIQAAIIQAQISQIEEYTAAASTFREKYGYLPGDIPDPYAQQFGFLPRGTCNGVVPCLGEGDGDGLIQGVLYDYSYGDNQGYAEGAGETVMFWRDLGDAQMIDAKFTTATPDKPPGTVGAAEIGLYFPQARIGQANYIDVWSGGPLLNSSQPGGDQNNYFGLMAINGILYGYTTSGSSAMTVEQAYVIDTKIDDGLPQSGTVLALGTSVTGSCNQGLCWAAGGGKEGAYSIIPPKSPTMQPTPWAPTNCYDNNGIQGAEQYSMSQNSTQMNCVLSFAF